MDDNGTAVVIFGGGGDATRNQAVRLVALWVSLKIWVGSGEARAVVVVENGRNLFFFLVDVINGRTRAFSFFVFVFVLFAFLFFSLSFPRSIGIKTQRPQPSRKHREEGNRKYSVFFVLEKIQGFAVARKKKRRRKTNTKRHVRVF